MIQRLELFWNTYFDFQYGVALIIGIVLFTAVITAWICLKRRRREAVEVREIGCILLLCIYLTFLFGVTLFNRHPEESRSMELMPLWSYQESLFNGNTGLGQQIFYNILAFIPWGIFLPVLSGKMQKFWRTAVSAAALSAFIEISQLVFRCGLCELDDVMNNTLGAAAGYGIWKIVSMAAGALKNSRRRRPAS